MLRRGVGCCCTAAVVGALSVFVVPFIGCPNEPPPIPCTVCGDLNLDGVIDQLDFEIMNAALGSRRGDPNWNSDADLNDDGVIDAIDLQILDNLARAQGG